MANEKCRSLIVDTYKMFGMNIGPMSFSSTNFEELNITVEEFNSLDPDDQSAVYTLIKPISLAVEDTIATINGVIERYSGTEFEIEFADALQILRFYKDQLRVCESKPTEDLD